MTPLRHREKLRYAFGILIVAGLCGMEGRYDLMCWWASNAIGVLWWA